MAKLTLGNHLKLLRMQAGLTQAELAERVSVSRKTINTVENGVFTPSTTLALLLARSLGVPVEALFFLMESTEESGRRAPASTYCGD